MKILNCPRSLNIDVCDRLLQEYQAIVQSGSSRVIIDCSDLRFIKPFGVTLLSSMLYRLLDSGAEVGLKKPPAEVARINKYLGDIGFYSEFAINDTVKVNPRSTSVSLRRLDSLNYSHVERLITWLGRGVTLSRGVKQALQTNLIEIITNALDHSKCPFGCYVCAQWYPKLKRMELCIMDFGIGIYENLKPLYLHLRSDAEAVKYATQEGISSRARGGTIGLGLATLKAFVNLNKGSLTIVSRNGKFNLQNKREQTETLQATLPGTCVQINIINRDVKYYLTSENPEEDIF